MLPGIEVGHALEHEREMSDMSEDRPMSGFRVRTVKIGLMFSWIVVAVLVIEGIRLNVLTEPAPRSATIGLAAMLAALHLINWETIIDRAIGKLLLILWGTTTLLALAAALNVEEFAQAALALYLATIVFVAVLGRTRTVLVVTLISISSYVAISVLEGRIGSIGSLAVPAIALAGVAVITRAAIIALSNTLAMVASQRDELARNEVNFERLYEVSRTIAAGDSLENVLPELVGRIGTYLECEVGLILLKDQAGASLDVISPIWSTGHSLEVAGYRIGLQDSRSFGGGVPHPATSHHHRHRRESR